MQQFETYALSPLCHSTPRLADKLLGVKSDLDPVVEEGEEGSEGEGGDEDGDEAELENHLEVLLEQALVANEPIVRLDLRLNLAALLKLLLVPPGLQLGDDDLLGVVDALLPHHDHSKLLGKLNQASTCLIRFKRCHRNKSFKSCFQDPRNKKSLPTCPTFLVP